MDTGDASFVPPGHGYPRGTDGEGMGMSDDGTQDHDELLVADLVVQRLRAWGVPRVAAAVAFVAAAVAFHGRPRTREMGLFTVVDDWPDTRLQRQQVGTPWAPPLVGAALWLAGHRREAVAAVLSLPASKGVEVAVKKVLQRPRPLYETPTVLRDDAPVEGPSFPSGHAALAAAAAYLVCRAAPPVTLPVAALTTASSLVRVHQGAHWPSDALAGTALGVGVAAGLRLSVMRIGRLSDRSA